MHQHSHNCSHSHDHKHSHAHSHGHHGHSHAPASYGRAFAIGISLNVIFVALEIYFGIQSNSLALLADAGHNASDVLGLLLAWGAFWLSGRKPCSRYTYGLQNSAILAALFNAVLLLVATGGIIWEAAGRFATPQEPAGVTMMWVACAGILINFATAMLFHAGSRNDINIRGAYLHMMADAAVSLAVVVSGAILLYTGWLWVDPVISIIIALVIIAGTWSLLRESLAMTLSAVPSHIDAGAVRAFLEGQAGVAGVHDLHIWPLGTQEVALTAHLMMPGGHPGDKALRTLEDTLHTQFGIGHITLQIELGDTEADCPLVSDSVL